MNVDEIQTIGTAITVLEKHGYADVAAVLRLVSAEELAKVADSLHDDDEGDLAPGIASAREQRILGINR
jgi:hypothetical protein